jgi:hypothetical protein
MADYRETIEHCAPPSAMLDALSASGFREVTRCVQHGILSEFDGGRSTFRESVFFSRCPPQAPEEER